MAVEMISASVRRWVDENGDEWVRVAPFSCWERVKDQLSYAERRNAYVEARRKKRNENRLARGKRKKSPSQFSRSADRYAEYIREDCAESFGEWLQWKTRQERRF